MGAAGSGGRRGASEGSCGHPPSGPTRSSRPGPGLGRSPAGLGSLAAGPSAGCYSFGADTPRVSAAPGSAEQHSRSAGRGRVRAALPATGLAALGERRRMEKEIQRTHHTYVFS